MITVIACEFEDTVVEENLQRIVGQIFKLLPMREEKEDWIKPLDTLLVELSGLSSFLGDKQKVLSLICKLQGLKNGGEDLDFMLFRRTIFEACSLTNELKGDFCVSENNGE